MTEPQIRMRLLWRPTVPDVGAYPSNISFDNANLSFSRVDQTTCHVLHVALYRVLVTVAYSRERSIVDIVGVVGIRRFGFAGPRCTECQAALGKVPPEQPEGTLILPSALYAAVHLNIALSHPQIHPDLHSESETRANFATVWAWQQLGL